MRSSVDQQPGEPILVVTLNQSIILPDSHSEYYALTHRLSQMLRQFSGSVTCIIDATCADSGSAQRLLSLIDTLKRSGSTAIRTILVIDKYSTGPMRLAMPVYSTMQMALAAARQGMARAA